MLEMKKNRLEVRIEHSSTYNREIVMVGNYSIPNYYKFKSVKEFIDSVSLSNDLLENFSPSCNKYAKKERYKAFADEAGCTAAVLMKHVNGLLYKHYVGKYDNYHVKKFCLNPIKKCISTGHLYNLQRTYDKLDQAKADGIYHIAPYVFNHDKTPAELKVSMGKGVWKRACKLSFGRNKLLSNRYLNTGDFSDNIPSSLLKDFGNESIGSLIWLRDNFKGKWTKKRELEPHLHIFNDTWLYARTYNLEFNNNWNPEVMRQKHDEYLQYARRTRYQLPVKTYEVFEWYEKWPVKQFNFEEYTATLLNSEKAIEDEGEKMHHCVGNYSSNSKHKKYMVYSVTKNGVKYSTIGLLYYDNNLYANQHYKVCNQSVDCEIAETLPRRIIEEFYRKESIND